MNRLIMSVTVHYKNGEKQKLALVETEQDYVIAPYFISETEGWGGSGEYLRKQDDNVLQVFDIFYRQVMDERDSAFVDKITF